MTSTRRTAERGAAPDVASPSATGAGILAMLPMIVAYAPFALVIGAAVAQHGAPLAGWAGSWLIFGGSAHLATIRTLDDAGAGIAILTGLLINSRLVVYSASLARRWPEQPMWFRVAAAALIIDPTWAAAERHADQCTDVVQQRRYFLAAGLTSVAGGRVRSPPVRSPAPTLGRSTSTSPSLCACWHWWVPVCEPTMGER